MPKKVALISDIQGNLTALKQVLSHIKSHPVDQIVCLGDVASGANPHEVLVMLRENQIHVVKGNMDDAILNPHPHEVRNSDIQRFDEIDQWCSEQLTDLDKVYMRSFSPTILIDLNDDYRMLCFHGSPYSYNDVIDETIPDKDLSELVNGYTEKVMATGHMHHPFLRPFHNSLIINPGSVGLPRKRQYKHPLQAEYAMLEMIEEQISIEFRSVPIPAEELKEDIHNSGMPHTEWFLSHWDIN